MWEKKQNKTKKQNKQNQKAKQNPPNFWLGEKNRK